MSRIRFSSLLAAFGLLAAAGLAAAQQAAQPSSSAPTVPTTCNMQLWSSLGELKLTIRFVPGSVPAETVQWLPAGSSTWTSTAPEGVMKFARGKNAPLTATEGWRGARSQPKGGPVVHSEGVEYQGWISECTPPLPTAPAK